MYNAYFGFSEKPFTIAPNPRYLFMSGRHQEALAHMLYGMQGEGGVMLLTGEVGTGKTTICRRLLEQVPEKTNIAYIINPKLTSLELLASICDELHITYPAKHSIKDLTDLLNENLLASHAKGQHTVVIIDEAQNLDSSVLEQLRLLTNLETNDKKLLQIMLICQQEMADM
jgi:general secretion pathway protein A